MIEKSTNEIPLEALPIKEKKGRNVIYDPSNPDIMNWLNNTWTFGYNPLAADHAYHSNKMLLKIDDGTPYIYSDPSHAYDHYQNNRSEKPKYLVHITQSGWVEYALKENDGWIGAQDQTWTASHDPRRWWGGKFPDGFTFSKPAERFVELMFDVRILNEMGLQEEKAKGSDDYYVFKGRLPLAALVPTSKAYLKQVLGFEVK